MCLLAVVVCENGNSIRGWFSTSREDYMSKEADIFQSFNSIVSSYVVEEGVDSFQILMDKNNKVGYISGRKYEQLGSTSLFGYFQSVLLDQMLKCDWQIGRETSSPLLFNILWKPEELPLELAAQYYDENEHQEERKKNNYKPILAIFPSLDHQSAYVALSKDPSDYPYAGEDILASLEHNNLKTNNNFHLIEYHKNNTLSSKYSLEDEIFVKAYKPQILSALANSEWVIGEPFNGSYIFSNVDLDSLKEIEANI